MGRREDHPDRPGIQLGINRGPLRPDRVEHGPQILGPFFPGRQGVQRHRVGGAGAAAVEHDEPAEGGQPLQKPGHQGVVPLQVDVLGQAVDIDQVQGPLTQDLVGDIGLTQRGVPGLRDRHARSWSSAFPLVSHAIQSTAWVGDQPATANR
jgi:hypothetical protein